VATPHPWITNNKVSCHHVKDWYDLLQWCFFSEKHHVDQQYVVASVHHIFTLFFSFSFSLLVTAFFCLTSLFSLHFLPHVTFQPLISSFSIWDCFTKWENRTSQQLQTVAISTPLFHTYRPTEGNPSQLKPENSPTQALRCSSYCVCLWNDLSSRGQFMFRGRFHMLFRSETEIYK